MVKIQDNYELKIGSLQTAGVQSIQEREDKQTIAKVSSLQMPEISPSTSSLSSRNVTVDNNLKNPLFQMEIADLQQIDANLDKKGEANYMIRLQELIGELLKLQTRISERDKKRTEELKVKYKTTCGESAALTRTSGKWNFWGSMTGFVILMASQYAAQSNADTGALLKFLADNGCQNLTQLFQSQINSDLRKVDGLTQLLNAEYTAATQKGSSEGNNKQELISILEKLLESIRSAARAG
jgi:hypothetical protein